MATQYIKGKDGKLAGSIGGGKTAIPTAGPSGTTTVLATPADTKGISSAYDKFQKVAKPKRLIDGSRKQIVAALTNDDEAGTAREELADAIKTEIHNRAYLDDVGGEGTWYLGGSLMQRSVDDWVNPSNGYTEEVNLQVDPSAAGRMDVVVSYPNGERKERTLTAFVGADGAISGWKENMGLVVHPYYESVAEETARDLASSARWARHCDLVKADTLLNELRHERLDERERNEALREIAGLVVR